MDRIEITGLSIPELKLYTELNEPQLLHYYEPKGGIFIAESAAVIERALDAGCEPVSFLIERKWKRGMKTCSTGGKGSLFTWESFRCSES